MTWNTLAIGDFCRTGSGGTPSRKKASRYFGGNIPWVKSGELREGVITETEETITELAVIESSAKFIPKGALLVAMYGATIGRVAKLGIDATSNQAVCHILPDESFADMQYMFHALQAQVPHWLGKGVGGAQPNISQEIIKNTVIPLPPLEEQRRIAAILDKAAKLKSMSNKAHQIIADARTSRLRDLLCGATAHQSAWERVPISELIREQPNNGIFRKNHEYDDPSSQGLPVIWVEQLFRGEVINTIGCRLLNASEAEVKKYGLFNGDILFCRSSLKPEGIAKPNIYTGDDNQALFECHLI